MIRFYIVAIRECNPDLDSRLIMESIKANYSHSAVLVKFIDHEVIFEAVDPVSRSVPAENILKDHFFTEKIEITDFLSVHPMAALGWLNGKMGIEYGFDQWPGFLMPIMKFMGRNKAKKMVCSEFVAMFLNYVLEDKLFVDPDFTNPKQVTEGIKAFINKRRYAT